MLREFRFAVRLLLRHPVVPVSVVIPIALAIAINSALFSVVDGLLFRPLPFARPEQLVAIDYRMTNGQLPELAYLPGLARERDALRARLAGSSLLVGAAQAGFSSCFGPAARAEHIEATAVDPRFFRLLGISPVLGVGFREDDASSPAVLSPDAGVPLPIVISHALWLREYGARPTALGLHEIAGRPVDVVGVMGPGVKFPAETDVWCPTSSTRSRPPAYARLAPGATAEQLSAQFPQLRISSLRDAVRPGGSRALVIIFAAAALLLLVAWVQVAALMCSVSAERVRDIGVHLALGAGRGRIVRQFGVENGVLALLACAIAAAAAGPLTTLVVGRLPAEISRGQYLLPDARTFVFTSAASAIGFGMLTLVPIALVRRTSPSPLLHRRRGDVPFATERLRKALLVTQVTMTTLLLYVAGLAVHSFVRVMAFDYGFDAERVLILTPPPWARQASTNQQLQADYAERNRRVSAALDVLRALPEVSAAATLFDVPIRAGGTAHDYEETITHLSGRRLGAGIRARSNAGSARLVAALGATLIEGRDFEAPEFAAREDVVLINEALADRLSPVLNIAGDRIRVNLIGERLWTQNIRSEIIGILRNVVVRSPALSPEPEFFTIDRRAAAADVIAIRASVSADAAVPAIRASLQQVWAGQPVLRIGFMRDALRNVVAPYRGESTLLTLIALFCVPLAAVGLTGALTYSITLRRREIAIRIAIGADPARIRRRVIRDAMVLVGSGVVLGTALGVGAARLVASRLFEVQPADPWTAATVAAGFMLLAGVAALAPAHRAAGIEPAVALRD